MQHLTFAFVTGNRNKLREAERILGFLPDSMDVDLPEVQSLDLLEVVHAKADEARKHVDGALVVEETGLELHAMNGFPGPLVKWMLQAIGPIGIARSVHALDDARATARCLLVFDGFVDGEHCRLVAEGATHGRLVLEPQGDEGFGWDPIFVPDGEERTYAQLSGTEKDVLGHRGRAWKALQEQLRPSRR